LVDVASGARRVVLDSVRYVWASAAGRYLLSFDGRDYWTDDVRTGAHRNITRGVPASFADTAYDTPTDILPPFGVGGWADDARAGCEGRRARVHRRVAERLARRLRRRADAARRGAGHRDQPVPRRLRLDARGARGVHERARAPAAGGAAVPGGLRRVEEVPDDR